MPGGLLLSRSLKTGVRSLALHKLRSLLTTLGVFLGTAAVIVLLAFTEGSSRQAQEQIRQLGSRNVILRSIKPPEDPNQSGSSTRVLTYGLTHEDLERVEDTFPSVERVVPVREIPKEVRYRDQLLNPRVLATRPNYLDMTGRLIWDGRFLTEEDERTLANVVVLGTEVARHFFPFDSPLDKRIKIGGDYFRVVGTLAPRVKSGDDPARAGEDITGELFIPFETARKWFGLLQVKRRQGSMDMEEIELHEIVVEVDSDEAVERVAGAARTMLSLFHKKKDYELVVPLELLARARESRRIWNILLLVIAAVSLLVGGIGIMNVMLATVTERTREIGVRRALGAKQQHIVMQFLVETGVLSVGGGLLGVLGGIAVAVVLGRVLDLPTEVTLFSLLLAFGISAGVGVIAGLYPATRAATMDPVEALRHE